MTLSRFGLLALACAALAATGCSAGKTPPAANPFGALEARVATPPAGVKAVLVTVTAADIATPMRATLTADVNGSWSGRVLNVPPGTLRTVTAYAYDTLTIPADPEAETAGLVYKGSRTNVMVTSGQVAAVFVTLLPWPDGGGGIGLNTPPHILGVSHAATLATGATATFQATAADPDAVALLTYEWTDDAGGVFSGGDGAVSGNHPTGEAVSIDYTPPAGFTGTATIRVTVTDGTATTSTTFPIAVGSGVSVGVVFDALPSITILPGASQALVPGAQTVIDYELAYPAGVGVDAPFVLEPVVTWTDTCGGSFGGYQAHPPIFRFDQPRGFSVFYTAPAVAPPAPGRCDLVITLTSQYGATIWSGLIAWVNPTVTGVWAGPAHDAVRGDFTATFDISQAGDSVAGTYTTSFGGAGTFSGITDGTTVSFTVEVTNPQCPGTLTGTAEVNAAGNQMTMSYTGTTSCMGATTGFGALARTLSKIAFVTSTTYDGNLGGVAGADARCQARADVGINLGTLPAGTYRAFLSDGITQAASRVADARWTLGDGTLLATSKADLLDGFLPHAISMDEYGTPDVGAFVWTGSNTDGTLAMADRTCTDWTSSLAGDIGVSGASSATSSHWTFSSFFGCNASNALYCLQQ